MEVKCSLCGCKEKITKVHKDYCRLARGENIVYVCEICRTRLHLQAVKSQKEEKPI